MTIDFKTAAQVILYENDCLTWLLAEARWTLEDEREDYGHVLEKQGRLLTSAVNTLRGDPPPLTTWSHHDVAELAAAVIAERDQARETITRIENEVEFLNARDQVLIRAALIGES